LEQPLPAGTDAETVTVDVVDETGETDARTEAAVTEEVASLVEDLVEDAVAGDQGSDA
jgi:hypothetical protein